MKHILRILVIVWIVVIIVAYSKKSEEKNIRLNEAAQRYANYEYDDIKITEIKVENDHIIGVIQNISDDEIKYLSIQIDTYDQDNNKLESLYGDSIENLNNGETWKFKIYVYNDEASKFNLSIKDLVK
jgi:hypothetical protein